MKKEITSIIAGIVSLLLALFIVAYTFAIFKNILTKSNSEIVLYFGVVIVIHQVLMRVESLQTLVSDFVCMIANAGLSIFGALGSVISALYLLKEWMFEGIDQGVLIMFIVCLGFLFYSLKLLPEKFKATEESY